MANHGDKREVEDVGEKILQKAEEVLLSWRHTKEMIAIKILTHCRLAKEILPGEILTKAMGAMVQSLADEMERLVTEINIFVHWRRVVIEFMREGKQYLDGEEKTKMAMILLGTCFFLLGLHVLRIELREVALLVQNRCEYGSFAEWPDGRRPPCTTMPWTIWPALVVLWGVCWMFYPPVSISQWNDIVSSCDPDDFDFGLDSTLNDTTKTSAFYDLFQDEDPILVNPYSSEEENWPGLAEPTPQLPVQGSLQILGVHSILGVPEDSVSRAELITSNNVTIPVSSLFRVEGSIQGSSNEDNEPSPLICLYDGCVGEVFTRKCDLKRHILRKHERPHKCPVPDCASEGFGTKVDLDRHIKSVHQDHNLFCPVADCNRAENAPVKKSFHRRDNLDDHLKRRHPSFSAQSAAPVTQLTIPYQTHLPLSSKRRRQTSPSDPEDEDHEAKRISQLETALEEARRDKEELRADKKELKEELQAVKSKDQRT